MKSPLITLSALCLFAGTACAQSSVTMFGVVDLGVRAVKNGDGRTFKSLTRDGLSSSRLGFRGEEDMGAGLKASFWLEAALAADTGLAGTTTGTPAASGAVTSAKFFDRRATMSLSGPLGEVRLGRDYTPTFTNLGAFDAYGSTGFAGEANLLGGGSPTAAGTLGSGAGTLARADNSLAYWLPRDLGGVYGTAMVAASEGINTSNGNNRYVGGRVGYAAGRFDGAIAYGRTRVLNGQNDFRVWNAGAAYDLSVVKLMVLYHRADYAPVGLADRSQTLWVLGAQAPLGPGTLRATFQSSNMQGGTTVGLRDQDDARQYGIGYVYNFSKRTAVYADAARIRNSGLSALAIGGGTTAGSNLGVLPDRNSTAFVLGLRHVF